MIIRETNRGGTRGSSYVYLLVGNKLVHVSKFAKSVGRDDPDIYYYLPDDVANYIYVFDFSRSGYAFIRRCPPGDFKDPMDFTRCEGKGIEEALNDWLAGVEFDIGNKVRELVELFTEFVSMAEEVKNYWRSLGGWLRLHAERLSEFFRDTRIYYFSQLSIPNDAGRIRGIKNTMSLVYENWIAAKIAEALGARSLVRRRWEIDQPFSNRPVDVWFEQGGTISYAILDTPYGPVTMWVEFQVDPAIHVFLDAKIEKVGDKLAYRRSPGRRPVRPDIVIAKGKYDDVNEFLQSNKEIDLLVECKVLPFDEWRGDIDQQIIPYMDFNPRNMVVVSRYEVPNSVKAKLSEKGIGVVDGVKPGSRSLETLKERVQVAIK
ncbi:MAG: hypothetical protein ABWJ97_01770 [Thermoproteus sp.]